MPIVEFDRERTVEVDDPDLTLLEIAREAGIPHASACGGNGRCSTCRVMILEHPEHLDPRNAVETRLARAKGFGDNIRLACQTTITGDVKLRRLVIDEEDLQLAQDGTPQTTGKDRQLAILFSDIRNFTPFAESHLPYDVIHILGRYFRKVGEPIIHHGGYIDKYMGDGIMAFWGAPSKVEDHALRACVASLRCQRRVAELAKQGTNLATRIGLATGVVLVGNVGSHQRMNYTVMGDVANLASRIEGLNKQYGTFLMISEATYDLAKDEVIARPIDVVAVKGKKQGVPVYELLALKSDNDATAEKVAEHSKAALEAYLDRRFDEAATTWSMVLQLRPGDQAATVMHDRALAFVAKPPPPEWTGVWVATSK